MDNHPRPVVAGPVASEHTDTLLSRFDRAAMSHPEVTAIRVGRTTVTYQTLAEASHALATALAPFTADRPGPVAVLRPQGPGQICAALAAMRCGRPYLPVDLAYPRRRLDRILADAAPAAVVGGTDPEPASGGNALEAAALVSTCRVKAGQRDGLALVTSEDAYAIYTSGSTGAPKGIVIPHRGIVNLLDECAARCALPPGSRHSICASPGFDASIWETWTSLAAAGELVVMPDGPRWDPTAFTSWLAGERIANAYIPAAFLPELARALRQDVDLRSLRRVIVAVEPIPRGLLGDIKRALPGLTLLNGYGPTETSVCCLIYEVTGEERGAERAPIGVPIRHVDLTVESVADGAGIAVDGTTGAAPARPTTAGETSGELHIGGVGVGRYLRPGSGQGQAFYQRSTEDGPPRPFYRTGDVVRVDSAGVYTFLGRTGDMVKVRGYRVEPGDIEHALLRQTGVVQAVVLKRTASGAEHLVAHVVPEVGAALSLPRIRAALREELPWYALPRHIILHHALPLTEHGKVDRRALATTALPPSSPDLAEPSSPDGAPGTTAEAVPLELTRLWNEVLGPSSRDSELSFLACGGDSLAAHRLASAVEGAFGRQVAVLDVLLSGSLAELRQKVLTAPPSQSHTKAAFPQGPVPASYGQRGLWFHDALHPGSPSYNEVLALRLRGSLDIAALEAALSEVVARHEALRTTLVLADGQLQQVVMPSVWLRLDIVDPPCPLAGYPQDTIAQVLRRLVRKPFDLARGPVVRAHLLRIDEREHLLALVIHHSALDGWSAGVLLDELAALYTAAVEGTAADLGPPPLPYTEHALWQHRLVNGGHMEEDLAYWRQRLAGLPRMMKLPTDFPRPPRPSDDGALTSTRVPPGTLARVDELAQAVGVTRFTVFLAVFHLLLSRYCRTDDVVVGVPAAVREPPGTERSIGYFLTVLPLRGDLSGAPTFRELLGGTGRTLRDAQAHRRVPLSLLAERLGRADQEDPLLQVCLAAQDALPRHPMMAGIEATLEYPDRGVAPFDLTVHLLPDDDGALRIAVEYRTDLFQAATAERLLGHLGTLLRSAAEAPDLPITRLSLLTPAEHAQVTGGFDGERLELPQGVGIHDLVDRWAERTPDAVALVGKDVRLSYRQLVERANRLAHYLAERGAEPGSRVGVRLPRGPDAVIAFLSVLKTGAAYVPLDPAFPPARLDFMAEDAGLVLDVTDRLLRDGRQVIAGCPARPPAVVTRGESLAYLMYTSGSTGRPKGVAIRHRGVLDLVLGAGYAQLDSEARVLHITSTSFDLATFEIWGALVHGARLVVAPPGPLTTSHIAQLMERHRITHGDMATALFHRQVHENPLSLRGLRTLIVGGEPLDPRQAAAALLANPGLRLINGYGPTEATTYSTVHLLTHPHQVIDPVPIGRPTPNTRVRILDPDGQPVPIGITGELFLGGPGLAAGYLNEPELTAERFVTEPANASARPSTSGDASLIASGADSDDRLYRTGDLARWRPDGTVDFQGRADAQIKLHGHRVEPGEIEVVMRTHPSITGALVIRREERVGHPYLAAYYTTPSGEPIPTRELTTLVAAQLPAAMVPRAYLALPRFPLTPSGKTDQAALPVPRIARSLSPQGDLGRAEGCQVPHHHGGATPGALRDLPSAARDLRCLQEAITAIWQAVMVADSIDLDERLFDIGGASLQVAQIHEEVAARFPAPGLRMTDLFTYPTIRGYAAHLHELLAAQPPGEEAGPVR